MIGALRQGLLPLCRDVFEVFTFGRPSRIFLPLLGLRLAGLCLMEG